jgi:polyhydroxybutyrate depolymerase
MPTHSIWHSIWHSMWRAAAPRTLLICAAVAASLVSVASPASAQAQVRYLSVGGLVREYLISAPAFRGPRPTVIVLHGTVQTGQIMMHTTGLEPLVDREGLVAVYPNGLAMQWNDGRAAAAIWGPRDDVAFLRALVAHLVRTGVADPHRVYVLGFSNGGMMALRMMCEATDVFAALAVIGASLPLEIAPGCRPTAPMPSLVMNGTADPFVPYEGGQVVLHGGIVLSTDQTLRFIRGVNGCSNSAQLAHIPDIDPYDGSAVVVVRWTHCASGAPVVLYRVEGGGHRIPNPDPGMPVLDVVLGRMNHDFDAAQAIWSFFKPRRRGRSYLFSLD